MNVLLPVSTNERKSMFEKYPKYPRDRMVIEDLGCLDGLQLLTLFESKSIHALTQDEALKTWKFLRQYLWDEEEVTLYVTWEHFRFGRGAAELIECITGIRERMDRGR